MGRRPHGFWGSPLLIALPPLVGPQALVKKPIRALALLLPLSAPPWCSPLLSSLVSCSLLIPHPPLKPPPSLPPSRTVSLGVRTRLVVGQCIVISCVVVFLFICLCFKYILSFYWVSLVTYSSLSVTMVILQLV